MRIAYVVNSVEGGGAAAPIPAIARALQAAGASLDLFALTRRDGRALPAIVDAGLSCTVRDGGETDHVAALGWLRAQLRESRPTLIWTSLTRATLLGQIAGLERRLPVISWQHNAYLKPANAALLRLTRRASALWVGDSASVTALTAQRLGIAPGRLACWPIFAADPDAPVAAPWRPGQTIRVGSLGRLHPNKGYDIMIAALARLKADGFRPPVPFELLIAGEGRERAALEARIREAGLDNIRLPGFSQRPKHFLAGLHLYAQPSRSEGFCIAAHEAMQSGLAVIGSAVGEMPVTIEAAGAGTIVAPGDPIALAAALAARLGDPASLEGAGRKARAYLLDSFSRANFERRGREIVALVSGA